jgi:hypothetical protein
VFGQTGAGNNWAKVTMNFPFQIVARHGLPHFSPKKKSSQRNSPPLSPTSLRATTRRALSSSTPSWTWSARRPSRATASRASR